MHFGGKRVQSVLMLLLLLRAAILNLLLHQDINGVEDSSCLLLCSTLLKVEMSSVRRLARRATDELVHRDYF
jgi:hypothetical protein